MVINMNLLCLLAALSSALPLSSFLVTGEDC
jgi:hypothetical protein